MLKINNRFTDDLKECWHHPAKSWCTIKSWCNCYKYWVISMNFHSFSLSAHFFFSIVNKKTLMSKLWFHNGIFSCTSNCYRLPTRAVRTFIFKISAICFFSYFRLEIPNLSWMNELWIISLFARKNTYFSAVSHPIRCPYSGIHFNKLIVQLKIALTFSVNKRLLTPFERTFKKDLFTMGKNVVSFLFF